MWTAPAQVILGWPKVGTAIDIWSLACIVFELITGDFLFDPKSEKNIDKDVYHLALFMQILGSVPLRCSIRLGCAAFCMSVIRHPILSHGRSGLGPGGCDATGPLIPPPPPVPSLQW